MRRATADRGGARAAVRAVARGTVGAIAFGALLYAGSERIFWSAPRQDTAAGIVGGIAVYAVLGVLLTAIRGARRAVPAVLLAGAAYGWLVEGVAASTLYGDPEVPFPATIAWTALAWHMPVVVLVTWWLVARLLLRPARTVLAGGAAGGAAWGVWAAGWGSATGTTLAFLGYAALWTAVIAVAHRVLAAAPVPTARPVVLTCIGVALAWFLVVDLPAIPWAPLVLVPLLAIAVIGARLGGPPEVVARPAPPVRALLALVIAVPLAAAAARAGLLALVELGVPLQLLLAALLTVGGTAAFVVALVLQIRRRWQPTGSLLP